MASRNLQHLSPRMQELYAAFIQRCAEDPHLADVSVLVTCTWRSAEDQAALYARGRPGGPRGPIVTNAKPGHSKHECVNALGLPAAEAFDVVPLRNGKCVWGTSGNGIDDDPTDDLTDDLELWQRLGAHGEAVGLEWYGSPGSPFKEFPHFQNPEA